MGNIFNTVRVKKPVRSQFSMPHSRKFSMDMGLLTPCFLLDVVPGTNTTIRPSHMIRFAPLVSPVMHNINAYIHYYFVPKRLLWDNFEKWKTMDGADEEGYIPPVFPKVRVEANTVGCIGDYLGLPVHSYTEDVEQVSALPLAAYLFIYNEYYRDQNLIDPLEYKCIDGDNEANLGLKYKDPLLRRAWKHDYFTSALPFAQKGPAVTIPLGTEAEVQYVNDGTTVLRDSTGAIVEIDDAVGGMYWDDGVKRIAVDDSIGDDPISNIDNSSNLIVNLENAVAATINSLRRAFAIQRWFEKNARGGTRYVEHNLVHYGVRPDDVRLQRPEYIGGTVSPVKVGEVMQTSASVTDGTPQGNLAGRAISVGSDSGVSNYYAKEDGYIMGIMSVMPDPAYYQGLPKHFQKFDPFDYAFPDFAHLGEQEILSKELYYQGSTQDDNAVFGYTPRYAEYRYIPDTVHGDFKDTLSYWHMAMEFTDSAPPALNQEFIECNPTDRIFAVQDLPDDGDGDNPVRNFNKLYVHLHQDVTQILPLPKWGIPI